MSRCRDDRDSARQRIADLEARLAEREAALSSRSVALAERDAEVARLRHQLILSAILGSRTRPPHAAWASRMIVLAVAIAGAALAVGVLALRAPRQVIIEVAAAPPVAPEPFLADPAPMAARHEPADEAPASGPPDEMELRRQRAGPRWKKSGC